MSKDKSRLRRVRRHSFTLIEIMIVVIIIGMLAALVGPNIVSNLDKSRVKTTKAQVVSIKNAVQQYYMDMSAYPTRLDELLTNPGNEKWDGPYLEAKKVPKDGWGNDFQYSVPGQDNMPFDIISYGGDKSSGGTGYNEDISCWN